MITKRLPQILQCAAATAALMLVFSVGLHAQASQSTVFQPVPELPYRVQPEFFEVRADQDFGESSAVALNSRGHIFLFQRVAPFLAEYDEKGRFVRSFKGNFFDTPHGLRIDRHDNLWTTDVGNHLVIKLNPQGRVLLVLGRKDWGAQADWLFNKPTDVAFDSAENIYVADGYGNSRIVKFDKNGKYLKSFGSYGTAPGQFNLPHAIVIDKQDRLYVADRENQRIQIFDTEGNFLKEWKDIGYPYGLSFGPDSHLWMSDGGYGRLVELDSNGHILGSVGEPGHMPGQFAWPHALAVGADKRLYVADVLNWRFQVFVPGSPTGMMSTYVPTVRVFNDSTPSTGWFSRQTTRPKK